MGRKKDFFIREYFDESGSESKCKSCGTLLYTNITNLKRHMHSKHPQFLQDYQKKIRLKNKTPDENDKKVKFSVQYSKNDVINACVGMVANDSQPSSVFDSECFQTLTSQIFDNLKMPRVTSSNVIKLVEMRHQEIKDNIKVEPETEVMDIQSIQIVNSVTSQVVQSTTPSNDFNMPSQDFPWVVFSTEEERTLEEYMVDSSNAFYGLSSVDARKLVFQSATALKKNIPPSWTTYEMADSNWFESFLRRHPNISLECFESISLSRSTAFSRHNVDMFFDLYDKVIEKITFEPQNIWSVGETVLTTVRQENYLDSHSNRDHLGDLTLDKQSHLVSLCLAINAFGHKAPSYLIFPSERYQSHFLNGAPKPIWGNASPSGCLTNEIFLDFLKRFQTFIRCSIEYPILLLLDKHDSHRSFDVLQFCYENGIYLLSFPPHCSSRMQPLNVGVFGSLKKAIYTLGKDWMKSNPGRTMQIYDLPEILGRALEIGATEINIKSSFEISGIYPLDRHKFQDIDFMSSNANLVDVIDNSIGMITNVQSLQNPSQDIIHENGNEFDVGIKESVSIDGSISFDSNEGLALESRPSSPLAPARVQMPR